MVRETRDGRNHFDFEYFHDATKDKSACVTANTHKGVPYNVLAEPVRIGTIENDAKNPDHDSQQYRVCSPDAKSVTLCGNGGGLGAKTGLYATPVPEPVGKTNYDCPDLSKMEFISGETTQSGGLIFLGGFAKDGVLWLDDGKVYSRNFKQGKRLYSVDGKSVTMTAQPAGIVGHAGLYAVPVPEPVNETVDGKAQCLRAT